MGELFRGDSSFIENDSLVQSNERSLVGPYLKDAPFEEFCGDVLMGSATLGIGHIDSICTGPLDLTPISSPLHPTTSTCSHAFHKSLMYLSKVLHVHALKERREVHHRIELAKLLSSYSYTTK